MKRSSFIVICSAILCQNVMGQKSYTHESALTSYNNAMQLYDTEMYGSARTAFDTFIEEWSDKEDVLTANSKFFKAVSAKMLMNSDAPALLREFALSCPQNIHHHEALYHLGDYFLIMKDEKKALDWFLKADDRKVPKSIRPELIFKTGYCYFMDGKHSRALAYFDRLNNNPGRYSGAMKYYRAHVDYEKGNLNEAQKAFFELEKDAGFSKVAPYYIAHICYLQGYYAEAVRYAEPLTKGDSKKSVDMVRIMADGHFMLAEYGKAIEWYKKLISSTRKVNRADYYHLGMCYYNEGMFAEASDNLSKVTSERDELSQNAYYHLADSYLRLGHKKKARVAFDAASKADFDRAIKEDAHFNKLKLAYELNFAPFNEIITQFVEFIDTYPNSDKIDEAYDFMGKAFVTTKNYRQALATMEKIKHKNLRIYTAMQRLAFYRGLELYENRAFDEAVEFFDYSLKYGDYDAILKARALYWKGECFYRTGRIDEANDLYYKFINAHGAAELQEFNLCHYNLGYTRFNVKDYNKAYGWFLKFTSLANHADKNILGDAYNRLGDCLYVDRNFKPAVEAYDKAIEASPAVGDYSMLQKGICLGFTKDNNAKIEQLQQLISKYPKSIYCANAYYEIARAHVGMEQIKEAIYNYKVVKERYPKSSLASKSMLQLGLLYYNNGEYDNSMAFYKRVINEYPATPEAMDALAGLRNVYMERGDFDGYMTYTSTLGGFARVDMQERDSLMFVSAQRLYLRGEKAQAKDALKKYLAAFGDGRFVTGANYYLGDCLYVEQDFEGALNSYVYVAQQPRSIYTEDALLRSGELLYKSGKYQESCDMFLRLEEEAEVETNKTEAIIGQMRCQQQLGDMEKCVLGADKVIAMVGATPEILREAKYLRASSLIKLSKPEEALDDLKELALNTKSVEGAEAKFRLAEIYFNRQDYAGAEKEVFNYIENGTPHQYWLARSFVLLADIYHLQGDDFQARQYLESLQENYNGEDDIDDMINARFNEWQMVQGSSSLPDDNMVVESDPVTE